MKRGDLLRHFRSQGCELLREGGRHSWWYNPNLNKRSSVPRHNEIDDDNCLAHATTPTFTLMTFVAGFIASFLSPSCRGSDNEDISYCQIKS